MGNNTNRWNLKTKQKHAQIGTIRQIGAGQSTDTKVQSTEPEAGKNNFLQSVDWPKNSVDWMQGNREPEPLVIAFGMPMCYSQSTDSRVQSTDWHQGCFPAYEMKMLSSSKCNRASTVTRGLCQSITWSYKLFDASPKTSSNYKAMIFEDLNSKH